MLDITETIEGSKCVVFLSGRLDVKSAQNAANTIEEISARNPDIVLDCAELVYIASAGLRALKAINRETKRQGGSLVLRNVEPDVMEVFEMTGFAAMLAIE